MKTERGAVLLVQRWALLHKRSVHNPANRRVVVTGLGAVTPLGNNVWDSWNTLISNGCGIRQLPQKDYENLPSRVAAQVNKDALNLDKEFLKSEMKTMTPAIIYSLLAAKEAVESANLVLDEEAKKERTGVCVGMGMVDLADVYTSYQAFSISYKKLSPFFVPRVLPNMACGQISIKYGVKGPNHAVSTACATGAHAIGDAYRFIKYNDADAMICGSTEACIDPLAVAGFCRLRALSTSFNDEPEKASRPFDKKRDGFVIGEGSAIFVLEELQHAKSRGANILAEILGYGVSGDASHLTAPSEDGRGAFLAMQRALNNAQLLPESVSYINAHATSTPIGDRIELKAITNLFQSHTKNLFISSTKGAHGHLLGAAGSLEALFVVLGLKNKILPPSINIESVEDDMNMNFVKRKTDWSGTQRRVALKNAFGFGGTNASLCIGEYIE